MKHGIGHAIREVRTARGWSQKRLAIQMGASQQRINQLENATENPRHETIMFICRLLGVPLNYIYMLALNRHVDDPEEAEWIEGIQKTILNKLRK